VKSALCQLVRKAPQLWNKQAISLKFEGCTTSLIEYDYFVVKISKLIYKTVEQERGFSNEEKNLP